MPEEFQADQPLWSEGYILFSPHPALVEDHIFNKSVRRPYSMTITNMYRDQVTVQTVCEHIAARMHATSTRWRDVVLFWDAGDGQGPTPLAYDTRLCDALVSQARTDADLHHDRRNRGRFCLYGPAHQRAVNTTMLTDEQHIDFVDHVRGTAPQGNSYPDHAFPTSSKAGSGPTSRPSSPRGRHTGVDSRGGTPELARTTDGETAPQHAARRVPVPCTHPRTPTATEAPSEPCRAQLAPQLTHGSTPPSVRTPNPRPMHRSAPPRLGPGPPGPGHGTQVIPMMPPPPTLQPQLPLRLQPRGQPPVADGQGDQRERVETMHVTGVRSPPRQRWQPRCALPRRTPTPLLRRGRRSNLWPSPW